MFRYTPVTLLREVLLILLAIVLLFPFYILVVNSLKSDAEIFAGNPFALPADPQWTNFVEVLGTTGRRSILTGFLNSLIITTGSIAGLVVLGSITSYVLIRATRRWGKSLFQLFVIAIALPSQLALVPLYIGARAAGLTGSVWGMIILYTGTLLPLAVFLYGGFFRRHPRDFEEAAAIDGAGPFRMFWHVVLPMMAPVTGTVAIIAGVLVWNDFFNALIFLGGSKVPTLPVVVYDYIGGLTTKWNRIFAVVILALIPILTFYLFAQKHFIQGFSGGLKS